MGFFKFLYANGLWISVLLLAAGAYLLSSFIRKLIRLRTDMVIVILPVSERQTVRFEEAGRVVLCTEGPFFSRSLFNAQFQLFGSGGVPMEGRPARFHARSTTFSRARMEMVVFELPMPGSYELHISNSGVVQPNDGEHRIVFMKPHAARMVAYILGILLAGWITIGSVVLFILRYLEVGGSS